MVASVASSVIPEEIDKFAQHATAWWDRNGPLKTLHDINPARLQFIARSVTWQGARVLDVGCGGGILSEAMAKLGAVVTGIDAEASAIATAKQHAEENGLQIAYHCTAIEDYHIDEGFDLITCMELLEHVQNPSLILEHCKRLLKPSGLLFLSTLNRTPKAYALAIVAAEYILKLLPKQTHDWDKFIKPSELNAMAAEVGLERLDMSGLRYNPLTGEARLCKEVAVNYLMAFGFCL